MTRSFDKKLIAGAAAGALMALGSVGTASAETDTVKMAQQFGLLYVPLHVVMEQGLIQKHAKAMGMKAPNIKLFKISGGANINKALLAGTIDFGAHGGNLPIGKINVFGPADDGLLGGHDHNGSLRTKTNNRQSGRGVTTILAGLRHVE